MITANPQYPTGYNQHYGGHGSSGGRQMAQMGSSSSATSSLSSNRNPPSPKILSHDQIFRAEEGETLGKNGRLFLNNKAVSIEFKIVEGIDHMSIAVLSFHDLLQYCPAR